MSEETNENNDDLFSSLDLALDDSTVARIAHADYLNSMKEWGLALGEIMQPFGQIAHILHDRDANESDLERAAQMFPIGLRLAMKHINEFYNLLQDEAVKVLGGPFEIHQGHAGNCEGTKETCPHQDHWRK